MAKRKAKSSSQSAFDLERIPKKSKRVTRKTNNDAIITEANGVTQEAFQERYIEPAWLVHSLPCSDRVPSSLNDVQLIFKQSKNMTSGETVACLDLVRETSKTDYEKSKTMCGWSDSRKKNELKDMDMRFLLVRRQTPERCSSSPSTTADDDTSFKGSDGEQIEGFLSFLIDFDSLPRVPVLYIYEIHLKEALRGRGMGQHLLTVAEGIAAKIGLNKLMLTCLLSNEKARRIYEKFGFGLDATSPEGKTMRGRKSKVDHYIMSKNVDRLDHVPP